MKSDYKELLTGAFRATVAAVSLFIIFSGGYIVQAQSGADIICLVYDEINQGGTPIPVLDASQCQNQAGDPPQCSDGLDNDGDGLTDEEDGGCHSDLDGSNLGSYTPTRNSEIDPGAPPRPVENTLARCSDGSDNDGNGASDLADQSCAAFVPSLILEKETTGGDGTFSFTLSGGISTTTSIMTAAGVGGSTQMRLSPGTTTITEVQTDGWVLTRATCSDGDVSFGATTDGIALSLSIGDIVTCLFENAASSTNTATSTDDTDDDVDTPPQGGSSNGGAVPPAPQGGGNGPIFGSFGVTPLAGGLVLGAATTTLSAPSSGVQTSCSPLVTTFIRVGGSNDSADVMRLQSFLISSEGARLALTGVYDAQTQAAVAAFQTKYAGDILAPWGITAPTSVVYLTTRKKVNELYCAGRQAFPLTSSEQQVIDALRGR